MKKNDNLLNQYSKYKNRKITVIILLFFALTAAAILSLCTGPFEISPAETIQAFFNSGTVKNIVVIRNIRLPRVLAAVIAGMALGLAGCIMQSLLKNPLASPFTMGISQAAAFGAAFAIIILGLGEINRTDMPVVLNNPYIITIVAFMFSFLGIFLILMLARFSDLSPRSTILAGISMGSLFHAATMLLQYFAEDIKVASVVFWTFGDVGRAANRDVIILLSVTIPALVYFILRRWHYNIIESGEETAKSLGVETEKLRFWGIFTSALITSVTVAFLGIIGFVGLVAPHIMRRIIGGDHRFLIPGSALCGGILLLVSDTAARTIMSPAILPVGILTSFMGVPLFMYLIISRKKSI
jgi:iron complex transport system permease protein